MGNRRPLKGRFLAALEPASPPHLHGRQEAIFVFSGHTPASRLFRLQPLTLASSGRPAGLTKQEFRASRPVWPGRCPGVSRATARS